MPKRGGQGVPLREPSIFEIGLVKPLVEVGDIGTPLTSPEPVGDLERRSVVRRRCGCAPEYKSRVVIGEEGCGRAGERESGASPGDAILREKYHYPLNTEVEDGASWYIREERSTYRELNRGLVSGIERLEKIEELGEK